MKKLLVITITFLCGNISFCFAQNINTLITEKSIGPVKVGDSMTNLKKLLPPAEYNYKPDDSDADFYKCVISNKKTGDELFSVSLSEETYQECDGQILGADTTNKIFKTAEGIGVTSLIADAEKKYGKATLSYNTENGSIEGIAFEKSHPQNMYFLPSFPGRKYETTGIYKYEGDYQETTTYQKGAYIKMIGVTSPNN